MADRKDEVIAAAHERLLRAEQEKRDKTETSDEGAERQIMYRGQVVRRPERAAPNADTGGAEAEVRTAIARLRQLYLDGLISRAEAEEKRAELLKRLDR